MGLELRAKKLLGGGDDDPLAGTAEAKSHGGEPRLACWHPIVPPSSAAEPGGATRSPALARTSWSEPAARRAPARV